MEERGECRICSLSRVLQILYLKLFAMSVFEGDRHLIDVIPLKYLDLGMIHVPAADPQVRVREERSTFRASRVGSGLGIASQY